VLYLSQLELHRTVTFTAGSEIQILICFMLPRECTSHRDICDVHPVSVL